jgi:hypothetical protein
MLGPAHRRVAAHAACVKRGLVVGGLAILALYAAACCVVYVRGFDGVFGRGLRTADGADGDDAAAEAAKEAAVRAELGHGVWNMLHRMAAQYDKAPTAERRSDMVEFFRLLGEFYPCPQCAAHFREMVAEHPVDATDNRALSLWLCSVHNIVNARLGKPQFPCTLDALKERWGECGCFDAPEGGDGGGNATAQGGGGGGGGGAAGKLVTPVRQLRDRGAASALAQAWAAG